MLTQQQKRNVFLDALMKQGALDTTALRMAQMAVAQAIDDAETPEHTPFEKWWNSAPLVPTETLHDGMARCWNAALDRAQDTLYYGPNNLETTLESLKVEP